MRFTVVTILPELIEPALTAGVVGRAREAGVIEVATVNPRDFTTDRHRTVDDTPYGGGPGMVMKPEPLLAAIAAATRTEPGHRVLVTPAGTPLTQARVRALAALPHVVLVCGRYEGVDERVIELAIDEQLSIGDYVLSGGELAALVVIDAVARFVPGVLGEATSVDDESHAAGLLEYPQYTRPLRLAIAGAAATPAGEPPAPLEAAAELVRPAPPATLDVPAILTSGNHAAIAAWRRGQAIERTARRRPDLFARFVPSAADRKLLPPPLHARTHLALVHHPVVDRTGAVITTALTNFDIHDLARSSLTYGLGGYHIVTPITSQRDKAAHIARLWIDDAQGEHRARALELVRTAESIEAVIAELTAAHGLPPRVVGTSARASSFPGIPRRTPAELRAEASVDPAPLLILLGTGWGLAEPLIPAVSRVLAPIEGATEWNHLSVRSAGAVLLDRLFGGPAGGRLDGASGGP
ncbi:MAG TPA: tRNA (guanosine(37)-N1)-methyltransferase TrmD [Kofleriaceae bacterium]|nr:tRNA (guanosine(37)-N1)-methyltransferase TrmD [Kofleriaceae bacterium]